MDGMGKWAEGDELVYIKDQRIAFGKLLRINPDNLTFACEWRELSGELSIATTFDPNQEEVHRFDRKVSEGQHVRHVDTGLVGEVLQEILIACVYVYGKDSVFELARFEDLQPISVRDGEFVNLNGWIGQVTKLVFKILVEYPDGRQTEFITDRKVVTKEQFGYHEYSKGTAPVRGLKITPTSEELQRADWKGLGFLDSKANVILKLQNQEAVIQSCSINSVAVDWLHQINPEGKGVPKPSSEITGEEIRKIEEFDLNAKNNGRLHSICYYDLPAESDLIPVREMPSRIIATLTGKTTPPAPKRLKKDETPATSPQASNAAVRGAMVEVMYIRHFYAVAWDGHRAESCPHDPHAELLIEVVRGIDLRPMWIGPVPLQCQRPFFHLYDHEREYVALKFHPIASNIFGVVQHRDMKNELAVVDLYKLENENEAPKFQGREEISEYEIFSHPVLGKVKGGAFVVRPGSTKVGTVTRINRPGMVEVPAFAPELFFLPSKLQVITVPDKITGQGDQEPFPDEEKQVDFFECATNDLREFLDTGASEGLFIRPKEENSLKALSVLMQGPEDTPYEKGLFLFDVTLPSKYPDAPPKVKLVSALQFPSMSSNNVTKNGDILHPRLDPSQAWSRKVSLLDFFIELKRDAFKENAMVPATFPSREVEEIFWMTPTVVAECVRTNCHAFISTMDELLALLERPPALWKNEVADHWKAVKPWFKYRLSYFMESHNGFLGRVSPKFKWNLSMGWNLALTRRLEILEKLVEL